MKRYKLIHPTLFLVALLFSSVSHALILREGVSTQVTIDLAHELNASYRTAAGYTEDEKPLKENTWQTVHFVSKEHVLALVESEKDITYVKYERISGRPTLRMVESSTVLHELYFQKLVLYKLTEPVDRVEPFNLPSTEEGLNSSLDKKLCVFTKGGNPQDKQNDYQLKAAFTCKGHVKQSKDIKFISLPFHRDGILPEGFSEPYGFLLCTSDTGSALASMQEGRFTLMGLGVSTVNDSTSQFLYLSQDIVSKVRKELEPENIERAVDPHSSFEKGASEVVEEIQAASCNIPSNSIFRRVGSGPTLPSEPPLGSYLGMLISDSDALIGKEPEDMKTFVGPHSDFEEEASEVIEEVQVPTSRPVAFGPILPSQPVLDSYEGRPSIASRVNPTVDSQCSSISLPRAGQEKYSSTTLSSSRYVPILPYPLLSRQSLLGCYSGVPAPSQVGVDSGLPLEHRQNVDNSTRSTAVAQVQPSINSNIGLQQVNNCASSFSIDKDAEGNTVVHYPHGVIRKEYLDGRMEITYPIGMRLSRERGQGFYSISKCACTIQGNTPLVYTYESGTVESIDPITRSIKIHVPRKGTYYIKSSALDNIQGSKSLRVQVLMPSGKTLTAKAKFSEYVQAAHEAKDPRVLGLGIVATSRSFQMDIINYIDLSAELPSNGPNPSHSIDETQEGRIITRPLA